MPYSFLGSSTFTPTSTPTYIVGRSTGGCAICAATNYAIGIERNNRLRGAARRRLAPDSNKGCRNCGGFAHRSPEASCQLPLAELRDSPALAVRLTPLPESGATRVRNRAAVASGSAARTHTAPTSCPPPTGFRHRNAILDIEIIVEVLCTHQSGDANALKRIRMEISQATTRAPGQRLPRFTRVGADVIPFRIEERDLLAWRWIYDTRFIPTDHLRLLLPGSAQQITRRAQRWFHGGYVDRIRTGYAEWILAIGK